MEPRLAAFDSEYHLPVRVREVGIEVAFTIESVRVLRCLSAVARNL